MPAGFPNCEFSLQLSIKDLLQSKMRLFFVFCTLHGLVVLWELDIMKRAEDHRKINEMKLKLRMIQ